MIYEERLSILLHVVRWLRAAAALAQYTTMQRIDHTEYNIVYVYMDPRMCRIDVHEPMHDGPVHSGIPADRDIIMIQIRSSYEQGSLSQIPLDLGVTFFQLQTFTSHVGRAWRIAVDFSFCTHNSYPLERSSGSSFPSFSPKDRNCAYKIGHELTVLHARLSAVMPCTRTLQRR